MKAKPLLLSTLQILYLNSSHPLLQIQSDFKTQIHSNTHSFTQSIITSINQSIIQTQTQTHTQTLISNIFRALVFKRVIFHINIDEVVHSLLHHFTHQMLSWSHTHTH
ncbi:hypothetical protein DFH28DRAFT_412277 [Melampsora americana]|nr:hypothetical protein DFH28DRAFT_412277 [Melampsora americana]